MSDELGELADRLNAALESVECALAGTQFVAKVEMVSNAVFLMWARDGEGWGLQVACPNGVVRLRHTSMATRIEAVDKLPELIAALSSERVRLRSNLICAIGKCENLACDLNAARVPS